MFTYGINVFMSGFIVIHNKKILVDLLRSQNVSFAEQRTRDVTWTYNDNNNYIEPLRTIVRRPLCGNLRKRKGIGIISQLRLKRAGSIGNTIL